jgi:hypothetical protein
VPRDVLEKKRGRGSGPARVLTIRAFVAVRLAVSATGSDDAGEVPTSIVTGYWAGPAVRVVRRARAAAASAR